MKFLRRHLGQSLLAGLVAMLPVGGTLLLVVIAERTFRPILPRAIYFPGLGILTVVVGLYLLGLTVNTFLGRWLWSHVDRLLSEIPALGGIYRTIKQVLGYGEGAHALFHRVVLVADEGTGATEVGLVTSEEGSKGEERLLVFVPGSPNPSQGRLLRLPAKRAINTDWKVDQALKWLFSLGKVHAGPR
jgi:uncharacterized membrane protein